MGAPVVGNTYFFNNDCCCGVFYQVREVGFQGSLFSFFGRDGCPGDFGNIEYSVGCASVPGRGTSTDRGDAGLGLF